LRTLAADRLAAACALRLSIIDSKTIDSHEYILPFCGASIFQVTSKQSDNIVKGRSQ